KRLSPLGFDWMDDDKRRPLRELPARLLRFAFQQFSAEPDMTKDEFERCAGNTFFGDSAASKSVADLLLLQECVNLDRNWVTSSPLLNPEWYHSKSTREKWSAEKTQEYKERVEQLGEIAKRYSKPANETERQMAGIASFIVGRWKSERASFF